MSLQQCFLQSLEALNAPSTSVNYVVAYSGGVDSHVLLHLCACAGLTVRAVHIHHGLQTQADAWLHHCQIQCEQLQLAFESRKVDASAKPGESPEAAARDARYRAIDEVLQDNEVLLLGQHKNDQAETVLLQLLRGAGPAGLSAMSEQSVTARGNTILRPLLSCTRDEIEQYALQHKLSWVEDPSNQDESYRRNALRQSVMPELLKHWSDAANQLAQVANQQQQTRTLIDELARIDLATVIAQQPRQIDIAWLQRLPQSRQFNVLRYWLHKQNTKPNQNCIEQILCSAVNASHDANPIVSWGQHEVRRFEQHLYLLDNHEVLELNDTYEWLPTGPMNIAGLQQQLLVSDNIIGGLNPDLLKQPLQVRFRQGGESLQPQGRAQHQSLKKLFQSAQIPTWQRQRIPLIYHEDSLIAVCGYWLADEHCVAQDKKGWQPQLTAKS